MVKINIITINLNSYNKIILVTKRRIQYFKEAMNIYDFLIAIFSIVQLILSYIIDNKY